MGLATVIIKAGEKPPPTLLPIKWLARTF